MAFLAAGDTFLLSIPDLFGTAEELARAAVMYQVTELGECVGMRVHTDPTRMVVGCGRDNAKKSRHVY